MFKELKRKLLIKKLKGLTKKEQFIALGFRDVGRMNGYKGYEGMHSKFVGMAKGNMLIMVRDIYSYRLFVKEIENPLVSINAFGSVRVKVQSHLLQ